MNTSPVSCDQAVTQVVAWFETLTPATVATLPALYATNARFKDPFNDVKGIAAITHIFAHMFEALEAPRFVVRERIVQGQQCFLTWEFRFRFRRFKQGEEQVILGGSHLVFDDTGLVTLHRDYWDAAEELYEKLPVVGRVMRWLKKRANS
ncbi:nuclear transport factor 2 family protein [Rhodoferax sp. TS-BS-61-7]|uniref:nuclear transport factor 2 family protein n=1 Tax=Rhodoferax sp. TS-BS-61-7 TaxID=2094194 RepID=UPI000CF6A16E|nr:nuclear transport factor 2 family protein [Rhodoferax sp. TS-BS-61-7]PQA75888.1 isomerase [Rhodoferax sp. TS-BS-61-7]